MKSNASINDLIGLISKFPLKSSDLNESSILKESINLFGSLMLQRVKSLLIDSYPDCDFSQLKDESSIRDIQSMINLKIKNSAQEVDSNNLFNSLNPDFSLFSKEELSLRETGSDIISLGVDIESINNFPDDVLLPTGASFRSKTFNPIEVAYALTRISPLQTLLGIFCAKEATIKCCSNLDTLGFRDIEIIHDSLGRPLCKILKNPKAKFKLSISHTEEYACAIVVRINSFS